MQFYYTIGFVPKHFLQDVRKFPVKIFCFTFPVSTMVGAAGYFSLMFAGYLFHGCWLLICLFVCWLFSGCLLVVHWFSVGWLLLFIMVFHWLFMFVICCSLKSLLICWFFTGHSWVVHLFSTPFMCMD